MVSVSDFISSKKVKFVVLGIVVLAIIGILVYRYHAHTQETLRQAQAMTEEQVRDAETLRERLRISEGQAEQLARVVERAQEGKVQPVTHVTVTAPTVERAAADIRERINHNDKTLPPAALEKTDRTVVAPQPDNKEYKVGVYKINLRKDHRIKAGVSVIDGKALMTVGYEQGRFEALAHFDGSRYKGATVTYNIIEW